jgi:mono/diheme cytochrome c family protein
LSSAEERVGSKSWDAVARCAIAAAAIALASATTASAAETTAAPTNPYEGNSELVPEGKSLFNQYCSHCHGPDAIQGERPRDLRRLRIRYGDNAIEVFYATINEGRVEKGMPPWKGVLKEDVIWRIFTFLSTVQTQP